MGSGRVRGVEEKPDEMLKPHEVSDFLLGLTLALLGWWSDLKGGKLAPDVDGVEARAWLARDTVDHVR
jgi:hypothetical protein